MPNQDNLPPTLLRKLRREAAARSITNQIDKLVSEQEVIIANAQKLAMKASFTAIDSAMVRSGIQYDKKVSKQVELDRKSLHDYAQENEVLREVLRRMG